MKSGGGLKVGAVCDLHVTSIIYSGRDSSVFTKHGSNRIGRVYKKAIYREYTDGTFSTQKPHRKDLGILGPVIRGELHDTITIYFKVSRFISK